MSQRLTGIVQVLASGFCFGFLGLFGKRAYASGISPGEFLALRYCLAAAMMFFVVVIRNWRGGATLVESIKCVWLGKTLAVRGLLLGILGYAVFSSFYFFALQRVSASLTVILLYTYPVLVAIGGAVFFNERVPRNRLPALPLAFIGLALLVWSDIGGGQPMGLVFGVLAAVFYSVYILLSSHWLRGVDAFTSTFWIQLGAGAALFVIHLRTPDVAIEKFSLAPTDVILIAFVCSVLAMSLFLSGLQKVRNWEASLLSMAEPITGVALGVLILQESLHRLQWIGVVFVLIALAIVSLPQKVDPVRAS